MIFDRIRAWRERREVFREIDEQRRNDAELGRVRFLEALEWSEALVAADQRLPARDLCRQISERFPRQAMESARFLRVLAEFRESDTAERLMSAGLKRRPRNWFYLEGYAKAAEWRNDYETAFKRWNDVLRVAPNYAAAYSRAAACLAALDRPLEADATLAKGLRKDPTDVLCLIEYAKIAETMHQYDEALSRWQNLIDFPSEQSIYLHNGIIGKCHCLRKIGRGADAEALLRPFIDQYGVREVILLELAAIAEDKGDLEEALKRYEALINKFPMFQPGYHGAIKTLELLGRENEADAMRLRLAHRFQDELWPWAEWARNAGRLGDGNEVAVRWHIVRERFPGSEEAWREEANAFAALGRGDEADTLRSEYKARFGA